MGAACQPTGSAQVPEVHLAGGSALDGEALAGKGAHPRDAPV